MSSTRAIWIATLALATNPLGVQRSAAQAIGGEVVEALTHQPLRGYPVRLFLLGAGDSTRLLDSTTTDDRGLFQMGGRGVGRYRIRLGPSDSRLETIAEIVATSTDTTIAGRFDVPVLQLAGAQAFSERDVQKVAFVRTVVPLRYPRDLLSIGVTGEVLVRFIVDPNGHVRPGSVRVVRSSHPAFTGTVLESLLTMVFEPAYVGGVAVPEEIEQPFTFSIEEHR